MIDIRHIKGNPGGERDARAGSGITTGPNIEYEGLVEWDANDRKSFEAASCGRKPPSTLAILLAQETWVCEALLRVIANCNEGAAKDKPSTAVVKRIEHLDIGQQAALAWIEAEQLSGAAAGIRRCRRDLRPPCHPGECPALVRPAR